MEDSAKYPASSETKKPDSVKEFDPFAGADAAMLRASKKAIAKARAAGLEPVLAETPKEQSVKSKHCDGGKVGRLKVEGED